MPLRATGTTLTSQLLLDQGGVDELENLQYAKLADLGIDCVDPANLNCFTALRYLDLSDNYVSMESLATLPSLQKLSLQCNQLRELVIPENSFALLEKLSAAGNSLSELSLIPLSKLPRLERLNLQQNFIKGIPEEVMSISNSFCQMEVLHLASNPVADYQRLTPLKRISKLRKVMLWDTPMAGRVAYDSTGKCLSISSPILQAAMEAQQAHQHWLLEKPDTRKPDIKQEEIMKYVVRPPKPFQHVIFTGEKMAAAIDKLGQKVAESCPNTVQGEDEHILAGSTSTIMPKEEGMDAQVAIGESGKMSPHSSDSTQCPSPFILEELQKMQDSESPIPHHMSEANAAVISLKLALKMIPFREPDLNPPSYRMPTRLGLIRFHQERMSLEPPITSWKQTLSMAHKFANRIESEARADVRTILETMKDKLEEIENHVVCVISEQKSSFNGNIVTCSPTSSLEEAEFG
ncbi:hypothetical protein BDL97_07G107900 [Sphagnum fallax]|nr:hypothetical protein BDL97_07G107900 [Sphagnum fallax]